MAAKTLSYCRGDHTKQSDHIYKLFCESCGILKRLIIKAK